MKRVLILLVFFLSVFPCLLSKAAYIYVPQDHTTIQAAIDAAGNGDTIFVAPGTYVGAGNKDLDFDGKDIILTSVGGPEVTIINCQGSGRGFHFHSGESPDSVVCGFTVTNGCPSDGWGGAIFCEGSSPTIESNIIINNSAVGGGGIFATSSSVVIRKNEIRGNTASINGGGIDCETGTEDAIIESNLILENIGGGIYLGNVTGYSPAARIENNVIARNVGSGIYCIRSGPVVVNNTIVYNTNCIYAVSSRVFSIPLLINNIVWGNDGDPLGGGSAIIRKYCDIEGHPPIEGNFSADPLFVDAPNGDYRLRMGSPCIDTGTTEDAPVYDIEGLLRDGVPDVGAYEFRGCKSVDELIAQLEQMAIEDNIRKSLRAKLLAAQQAFQRGQHHTTAKILNSFVNEVRAQRDKKLTPEQADELMACANCLISQLTGDSAPARVNKALSTTWGKIKSTVRKD